MREYPAANFACVRSEVDNSKDPLAGTVQSTEYSTVQYSTVQNILPFAVQFIVKKTLLLSSKYFSLNLT